MNALLVHVPKGFSSADWSHNFINIMPAGLFSLANYANMKGHEVKIINAAVHGDTETALRVICDRIRRHGARVVGMPIHWHMSGFDVCYAARRIKAEFPEISIVFGGITATVFAEDFLRVCPAVDALVRGDGEIPFVAYLDEVSKEPSDWQLDQIPNLCWRGPDGAVTNSVRFVATQEQFGEFDFSPNDALWDTSEYVNGLGMLDVVVGKKRDFAKECREEILHFLNVGRGCSLNCFYCAGSNISFARYFNRPKVMYRPIEAVLRSVCQAAEQGFRKFHICFDAPAPGKDQYFVELFRRIRDEVSPELQLFFECYRLPSPELTRAFSYFKSASVIISPCFFDPENMRRFKGYSYTRKEMEASLAEIAGYPSLKAFVYFAISPVESWDEQAIARNAGYMRQIKDKYGCLASAMPVYAEPGSPWVAFPERYGQNAAPLTFADFWEEWQKPLDRWNEKLCQLPAINEIVARLDNLMKSDFINTYN